MPKALHGIIQELAKSKLRQLLKVLEREPEEGVAIRLVNPRFETLMASEYTADLAWLLDEPPTLGVIGEVQTSQDSDKPAAWNMYVAGLVYTYKCPARVIVLTPDAAVERWRASHSKRGRVTLWRPG